MTRFFKAVTYDVCEHRGLYEHMNEYPLDLKEDTDKQIREVAKKDVASLVKLYKAETSEFVESRLYKEYNFKEYECGGNQ